MQEFVKNYEKYPEQLGISHNELRFLPEKTKNSKQKSFICNLDTKVKSILHIQNIKQV